MNATCFLKKDTLSNIFICLIYVDSTIYFNSLIEKITQNRTRTFYNVSITISNVINKIIQMKEFTKG